MTKHKVFISYHHANDQWYKNELEKMNDVFDIFVNRSVSLGDIDEEEEPQKIREIIRDEYLRDTSVLILLVGTETKNRKHVDWELYSSMRDSPRNGKSGIFIINLPSTGTNNIRASHGENEKNEFHPNITEWITINDRTTYKEIYPYMPERVIDNLMSEKSYISIVNWGNDSNLLIVFYVQIMPDDFVMQLHRF
ncbi:TIR domain-containing protein [Escherichia coli]|uniref:TIR domain-containing protein n=1 Tax=Enterobacter hormaechei TaxID=158836 RepID=UPI001FEB7662|nr:TIR domain-containing protein [Enterobacter hormaechei]MCN4841548.1 TIR domain-containing protein [Escherichia coli]